MAYSVTVKVCDVCGSLAYSTLHWEVPGFKRSPGGPCTNWRSTVNKGLLREEAELAAQNRSEWRRSVAQCIHFLATWMRVESRSRVIRHLLLQWQYNNAAGRYNIVPDQLRGVKYVIVIPLSTVGYTSVTRECIHSRQWYN